MSLSTASTYAHFHVLGLRTENPGVGGSIPSLPTMFFPPDFDSYLVSQDRSGPASWSRLDLNSTRDASRQPTERHWRPDPAGYRGGSAASPRLLSAWPRPRWRSGGR